MLPAGAKQRLAAHLMIVKQQHERDFDIVKSGAGAGCHARRQPDVGHPASSQRPAARHRLGARVPRAGRQQRQRHIINAEIAKILEGIDRRGLARAAQAGDDDYVW